MTLVSSRGSRVVVCAAAVLLGALQPLALIAQDPDPLSRLDPQTRFTVELIMDSARVSGVPTRPLMLKALEGQAKHVDNRHIVAAVRAQFHAELDVRVALGSTLNESECTAAAAALQAGVPLEGLAKFRGDRNGRPLLRALVTLTDLIQRGVTIPEASSAILQLWSRGAGESDIYGLWKSVDEDIHSGQNPGAALAQRMREVPVHVTPGSKVPPASQEPDNPSS